ELQNQGCWQAKEPHNVKEEKIVCKRCGSEEFNILKDSIHTVRCARCNFEVSYWNVGKITWLK
ncbi:MAG: hypothetical protein KGY70_14515, partial [Bacteroidales bacterium]|nr:hypothetical protein [Bacteroidales bacterium]